MRSIIERMLSGARIQAMFRWYLIHTKPCGEALAQENLERQGFETYLPRMAFTTRRQGRRSVAPLFPRYLFLQLEEGRQALSPVRSSVGRQPSTWRPNVSDLVVRLEVLRCFLTRRAIE